MRIQKNQPVAAFILVMAFLLPPMATADPETVVPEPAPAAPGTAGTPAASAIASFLASAVGAGLFFDVFPLFELSNRDSFSLKDRSMTAEELAAFADRPAFLSAGFAMRRKGLSAVMAVELHQDVGAYLGNGGWSNLILAPDSPAIMFGSNYPNVGYIELRSADWLVSAGRRRIGLGAGTYSLTVSPQNPHYDHAIGAIDLPLGSGKVGYAFVALNVQRTKTITTATTTIPGLDQKNLFIHRFSWSGRRFSVAVNEFNLIVGDSVDFSDVGPFLIYHHLYKENSNVMINLELAARPADSLRIYGEALLDDFQTTAEGSTSNPTAMGFMAGTEWKILDARRIARPALLRGDHTLRLGQNLPAAGVKAASPGATGPGEEPFARKEGAERSGGLFLKGESYLASTYLYRRRASKVNEAFTTRYFLQTMTASEEYWPLVTPFFSDPVGPDTWLNRIELSWAAGRLESSLSAEYRIIGSQAGQTTYGEPPYLQDWLGPQAPVSHRFDLRLTASYSPNARTILLGSASLSFRDSGTKYALSAGVGYRIGAGITPMY